MAVEEKNERLQIKKMELGPFGTNAYILTCIDTIDSVVVDAPGEASKILALLEKTNPRYILITHNHMDHTGALSELKSALKVPVAAHASDAGTLPASTDIFLEEGDVVSFGKIQLNVLHTPGHTPGSLCFFTDKYLISGDTIFPGGPGKTWSPADFKKIIESLTKKIFNLPDNTRVYPGHGDSTILINEKKAFEEFSSKPHTADLYGDVLWSSS
ncbi:MAG: MBL fold metallo-hydrolase [Desulfobacterales bacterium]